MKNKLLFLTLILGFVLFSCESKTSTSYESNSSLNDTSLNSDTSTSSISKNTSDSESSFQESKVNYYDFKVINGQGSEEHVVEGTLVTAEANPAKEGEKFAYWEDDNGKKVSEENPYSFEINENTTLSAVYEKIDVTLIVNNGTGSNTYKYGDSVTVTAEKEKEGLSFVGWRDQESNSIVSTDATYTFIILKNTILTAEYTTSIIHVTIYNGTGGGDYEYGEQVTVKADKAEPGKVFKCFIDEHGTVLSREDEYTFIAKKDIIITATFETINYVVTVTNGTGGGDYFIYGSQCTVQAPNLSGKIFSYWQDETNTKISEENPYTFTVTKDITLTAIYGNSELIEKPNNYDELVNLVASASLKEKNIETISYKEQITTNVSNNDKETNLNITFYKDGLVAEGNGPTSDSTYASKYDLIHAYRLNENKLYEVLDFDYAYASSYEIATAKKLVNNVQNENLEVLSDEANQLINNFKIINKLIDILKDFKEDTSYNILELDNAYKVTLQQILPFETNTMYGVYNLEINIDKTDQFILSYNYSHKSYVRATQLENDVLKQDAKPRDNIYLIVDVTRSKEELTNMPSDLVEEKIIKYFISDFSFTGSYYHNNTSRSFTSENILLASNVEITNWTMNVISPLNPIEKKTLYFISSSDENVIKINDNLTSIKTLNEGTSEVKVSTSAGISKTFTFNVGKLPPKSIIINCEDKVKIGELIDLSISVEPNDSLNEVTWSISNNEIAELVYQNNEVKLKGKKRGFVSLKATSTSDSNIVSEKTIYVSEGELSIEQLKSDLLGTWIHSLYSGSFTFEFKNNNQVVVTDTYRGITSKISCIATYEFIQENDENCTHSSSFSDFKNSDYYIIKLTVIEMTDSPAYQIDDFHLAFAKDGSELIFHCTANNYTLNYLLTKNN